MMDRQIKIVADEAIPFLKGVFEPYAEVVYRPGIKICRADLMDADALIIRTRTRCDENLLEGRSVAEGIQDIRLLAHLRIESAHLGVSSGIVRYRAVCVRGERDAEG